MAAVSSIDFSFFCVPSTSAASSLSVPSGHVMNTTTVSIEKAAAIDSESKVKKRLKMTKVWMIYNLHRFRYHLLCCCN